MFHIYDKVIGSTRQAEFQFGITVHEGKVLIDFGKPVRSIIFTPEQAREIATTLLVRTDEAEAGRAEG